MIQHIADDLQPDIRTLIVFDVRIFLRRGPYGSSQSKCNRLSAFCLSPKIHKERKTSKRLYQDACKGCCQHEPDFNPPCSAQSGHMLKPFIPTSFLPNTVIDLTIPNIPIEADLCVIGHESTLNPSQLGCRILYTDHIIICIFHICQISDQKLCIFARNRDSPSGQRHDPTGRCHHSLRDDQFIPTPIPFISQSNLFFSGLQIFHSLNRQNRMIAGNNIRDSRI